MMETRLRAQQKTAPPPSFTAVGSGGMLQRKCACGGPAGLAEECEGCNKQNLSLQRSTRNAEPESRNSGGVPPIVHEVLRSPGQPLDAETRAFMEPRFGHDFSEVRVHADTAAAESARAMNARAYTVGNEIVWGSGQYSPATPAGRHLLAHELTHVIQQSGTSPGVQRQTAEPEAAKPTEAAPVSETPVAPAETPAADPAIDALDLAATAKAGTQELKKKHSAITFTSGRRNVAEQASAMASNIVSGNDRKWIEKTYASAASLQKWVDDHADATTKDQISKGLEDTMNAMSSADLGKISKHLSGEAFDVQPQEADADAIKTDIKALSGLSKFLDKEGGLVRWHAQFKLRESVSHADDPLERQADQVAEQVCREDSSPSHHSPVRHSPEQLTAVHAQPKAAPPPLLMPAPGVVLQCKCACSGPAGVAEECEGCSKQKLSLQRSTQNSESETRNSSGVPPIVGEVLSSPGQPLDSGTRAFMEPRFGHDFSRVRIHNDTNASQSARAVNALAYTVGNDVVFDAGQYAPETRQGQRLLAHELTHVVQQQNSIGLNSMTPGISMPWAPAEREADHIASSIINGQPAPAISLTTAPATLKRTCGKEIGTVEGCTGVSEDISGATFLFKVGCDDFQTGEEAKLKKLPNELTSGDQLSIHGFASEEGPPELNFNLSCLRAKRAQVVLVDAGVPFEIIDRIYSHGPTGGPKAERRSVVIDIFKKPREMTAEEQGLLHRLRVLGGVAKNEGGGADFQKAVEEFRKTLKTRMDSLNAGDPLPEDVALIMKALMVWSKDPGNQWGEGSWDSNDLVMSAPDYVTVPASQYKCNAYVAEAIYQSLGLVFKVHEASQAKGKYFPYQAREWGDAKTSIPQFTVVEKPLMGDIWSNGSHTGIFLGEYAGKKLYISARDNDDGVFGIKADVQKEHGVQIKYLADGGVYRRYTP